MRLHTTLTAAAAAALALAGLAAAPAAAAELPVCNDYSRLTIPGRPDLDQSQAVPTLGFRTNNMNCKLELGDTGAGVLVLQVNLRRCYGQTQVALDAIYGPRTEQAVLNAQLWERTRQNDPSITVDGDFGPVTSRAIFWEATSAAGRHVGCDRRYR